MVHLKLSIRKTNKLVLVITAVNPQVFTERNKTVKFLVCVHIWPIKLILLERSNVCDSHTCSTEQHRRSLQSPAVKYGPSLPPRFLSYGIE